MVPLPNMQMAERAQNEPKVARKKQISVFVHPLGEKTISLGG